ncbi:MAG: 4-hydroxy-tetrahydrodipicolinate synthase [Bacteroidota bacterium]
MRFPQFRGTGVALVTPFVDGEIDFQALENIIEHCIAGGVEYLVSLGTTGESVTLTTKECHQVVDFTLKVVADRLPVVVGMFGGNNTANLVERIQQFDFSGCAGILSSNPSYNKPTQEGIFQHYMSIAEVCPVPIIIYNVPGRTSSNMSAQTVVKLAKASEKFVAIKEASASLTQAAEILKHKPKDFMLLSGDDPTALPLIALGGQGVISVIGNAYPAAFSDMVRAALNGDMDTASKLHLDLFDLHQWLYIEGNPAGIKGALELKKLCRRDVRLPLTALSDLNYRHLWAEMRQVRASLALKTS